MKILFICMGNICRSPTAEGVFRAKAEAAGLLPRLTIDSAGTHNYHPGEPPDARSQAHAKRRGYDLSALRARAVTEHDIEHFDLLIVMDDLNRSTLLNRAAAEHHPKVRRMMEFAEGDLSARVREVPDPYYGEREDFERVLDLVEAASEGLIAHVRSRM
ncbi:MAG: low molecular weight protein-tyrosine-phosphatase [Casimicrobium sp.]